MKFRFGKIYMQKPTFAISIAEESFFKGVTLQVVVWRRGYSLTITTKKIYKAYQEKVNKFVEGIMARKKSNESH